MLSEALAYVKKQNIVGHIYKSHIIYAWKEALHSQYVICILNKQACVTETMGVFTEVLTKGH